MHLFSSAPSLAAKRTTPTLFVSIFLTKALLLAPLLSFAMLQKPQLLFETGYVCEDSKSGQHFSYEGGSANLVFKDEFGQVHTYYFSTYQEIRAGHAQIRGLRNTEGNSVVALFEINTITKQIYYTINERRNSSVTAGFMNCDKVRVFRAGFGW